MRTARSIYACLLVCLALVAGCSRPDAAPQPAAAPTPSASSENGNARPRIVALGDSLTAGYGLVESQAFPALLQQKVDAEGYEFEVVNAGVSGDTSAGGLRRLDWALEGDVKILILALGANDGLRGLSVGEMKRNLGQIIDEAHERNITVVLAGMEAPPNYGEEYATAFRQAYRDLAREKRVLLIPFLLDKVAGRSELNLPDGIHPNPQGSAIVSETVWNVLRPRLDQLQND